MRTRTVGIASTALIALLSTVACHPTAATPPKTDTFTGVVTAGGFDGHLFNVNEDGEVDISFTALSPQSTITMGLGIGQPGSDGVCTLFGNINDSVGAVLVSAVVKGTYCYLIYDVGNVAASVNYTLTVTHP